jgi:hypothetical protein
MRWFFGLNCPVGSGRKVLEEFFIGPKRKRARAEFSSFGALGECTYFHKFILPVCFSLCVQVLRNLPAPASQPHLDEGTGWLGVRRKLAALAAAYGACACAVQLLRPLGTRPAHLLNGCGHRSGQGRVGEG